MITERQSFVPHWKELSQMISPRRGRFFLTDRNRGGSRYNNILNSEGTLAHQIAESSIFAGIMSPARPWFSLETLDADLMESQGVKVWLQQVEALIRAVFNSSNLYNMTPGMIGDLLIFATGCMMDTDDFNDVSRYYTLPIGSYAIAQNDRLEVDTLMREYQMTCEQLVSRFGLDAVSSTVRNSYDRGNYDSWHSVVQFIQPNKDWNEDSALSENKKFISLTYELSANEKQDQFLERKGYDSFPAYCPRWKLNGEDVYGVDCPGMQALGDIKGLQVLQKHIGTAVAKMVNPPMQGPTSLRNTAVSQTPGGLVLYDNTGNANTGLRTQYDTNFQVEPLRVLAQEHENRIRRAFFLDIFQAITSMEGIQPKNELELTHRNEERLLRLGPVLEQLQGEFLEKLIDRTFTKLAMAQALPPPPPELGGQPLRFRYISSLAMAQRRVATGGIERLVGFVAQAAGSGYPEALDKLDVDQAIDEYSSIIGVPGRLVVPDEQVAAKRKARQQAMARQQQLQEAQVLANTGKTLAGAKTGEPSLLTEEE